MFTSVGSRSALAYKRASIEASVDCADPHRLISLLFESFQQALGAARISMLNKDIPTKVQKVSHALRILEEGLIAPLNLKDGGEVARNLDTLYKYCVRRLVLSNAKNDVQILDEVAGLIAQVASGWKQINGAGSAYLQPV